jgi:hypothetical protein
MKTGTPSASLQGALRAGRACPNGHRTLWPRHCPHCQVASRRQQAERERAERLAAQAPKTLTWHNARQQAERQAARGWMEGLA